MEAIIPYYDDINRFLASTSLSERTTDPLFYCLRLQKNDGNIVYKPPFRRGFYFVGLLTNAERSKISYDNTSVNDLDSLIVFQAPGLMYSFYPGHFDPRVLHLLLNLSAFPILNPRSSLNFHSLMSSILIFLK